MKSLVLLRTISPIVIIGFLNCLSVPARAQQRKIPKEPLKIVDASTKKLIPKVLILPRYSSFKGTSTFYGEGPGSGSNRDYLAKPFVYRTGDSLVLKLPKSAGFALPGLLFIGKARSLREVFLIAPGYRPLWFTSLWSVGNARNLQLAPISNQEWSLLLEHTLRRLENNVTPIEDDCSFWDLATPCFLEIHYKKKERELIRSFLHQPRRDTEGKFVAIPKRVH